MRHGHGLSLAIIGAILGIVPDQVTYPWLQSSVGSYVAFGACAVMAATGLIVAHFALPPDDEAKPRKRGIVMEGGEDNEVSGNDVSDRFDDGIVVTREKRATIRDNKVG